VGDEFRDSPSVMTFAEWNQAVQFAVRMSLLLSLRLADPPKPAVFGGVAPNSSIRQPLLPQLLAILSELRP
jgi:hypothetical protein